MKTKNTIILLIIAVVVIGAIVYQKRQQETTIESAATPEKSIPAVTSGTLERITIKPPDAAPVTLTKKGDTWYTDANRKYEADQNAVTGAIKAVSEPIKATVVSSNEESFDNYQVTETTATKVQFFQSGAEKPELALLIGKDGPSAFSTYVRLPDSKDVLNAKAGLSMAFKRPDGWRNRQLFSFVGNNAVRVESQGTSATYTLTKSGEDKWEAEAPEKAQVELAPVVGITNMLSNLRVEEFADLGTTQSLASVGLEPARQKVTVVFEDKRTSPARQTSATLLIGNAVPGGHGWYAKSADKPDVIILGEPVAESLAPSLDKIRVKEPEPPAAPEASADDHATTNAVSTETSTSATEPQDDASSKSAEISNAPAAANAATSESAAAATPQPPAAETAYGAQHPSAAE